MVVFLRAKMVYSFFLLMNSSNNRVISVINNTISRHNAKTKFVLEDFPIEVIRHILYADVPEHRLICLKRECGFVLETGQIARLKGKSLAKLRDEYRFDLFELTATNKEINWELSSDKEKQGVLRARTLARQSRKRALQRERKANKKASQREVEEFPQPQRKYNTRPQRVHPNKKRTMGLFLEVFTYWVS